MSINKKRTRLGKPDKRNYTGEIRHAFTCLLFKGRNEGVKIIAKTEKISDVKVESADASEGVGIKVYHV